MKPAGHRVVMVRLLQSGTWVKPDRVIRWTVNGGIDRSATPYPGDADKAAVGVAEVHLVPPMAVWVCWEGVWTPGVVDIPPHDPNCYPAKRRRSARIQIQVSESCANLIRSVCHQQGCRTGRVIELWASMVRDRLDVMTAEDIAGRMRELNE